MNLLKNKLLIGMVLLLILALSSPLFAATITVNASGGADYTTIQAAMSAAAAGDIIMVAPGTYSGPVTMKDGVTLQGTSPDNTIINGHGSASQVVTYSGTSLTTIAGFTILGSRTTGDPGAWTDAGVLVNSGPLLIRNNVITQNWCGITVAQAGTPLILNNTIVNNHAGGIIMGAPPTAQTIKNNIIASNDTGIFYYGDLTSPNTGQISYNNVWHNTTRDYFPNMYPPGTFTPSPGTGEISADPMFVDATAGDYHLAEGSPCIDTGDPAAAYNDPDGTRNDMGAYGGQGGGASGHSGSGFIFTSIGKIPAFAITQTSGSPSRGLANVSATTASDLRIPQYKDSPFGGNLWLFGLFGDADNVDYYQILIAPFGSTNFQPLDDPLVKYRYEVGPGGTINIHREVLGPLSVGTMTNLYKLTRAGAWTPPSDLRLIMNSNEWPNGRYTLKYKAFRLVGGAAVEVALPRNSLDEIVIWIDNSQVEAVINLVKYDPSNPNYEAATDGEIPECGKINLGSDTENVRFVITARHPNGFLRDYALTASYGRNRSGGTICADQYVGAHDTTPPLWNGVTNTEFNSAASSGLNPWQTCPYSFHLNVWSRATDGYTYLYYNSFVDHYYIDLTGGGGGGGGGGGTLPFDIDYRSANFSALSKHRIHLGNVAVEFPVGTPVGNFWLEFDFNMRTLGFDLVNAGPESR
jgi:parallel beta-helix repeat protein